MGKVPYHNRRNHRRDIRVYLECSKVWVPEQNVEFENIEEDFMGRDVLYFKCPDCGTTHKSHRVG